MVDNLTSTAMDKPLSARQGKLLNDNKADIGHTHGENGFVDVNFTISDMNANREITITPNTQYQFYSNNILYTITNPITFQLSSSEGSKYLYFDDAGVLAETLSSPGANPNLLERWAYFLYVYYDATNNKAKLICEQHRRMPPSVHRYLHRFMKTQYDSGANITITIGNGSLDRHSQFSLSVCKFTDEDIDHSANQFNAGNSIDTFYQLGSNIRWATSAMPIIAGANGRACYNSIVGGVGSLVECANNNYMLLHIYAVPGKMETLGQFFAWLGQNEYSTATLARAGALTEANNLQLNILPFSEFKLLYTVIVQTSNSFANASKSKIVEVESGVVAVDWRRINSIGQYSAGSSGAGSGQISNVTTGQNLVLRSLLLGFGSGASPLTSLPNFIAIVGQFGFYSSTTAWSFAIANSSIYMLNSNTQVNSDGSATLYYLASA